MLIQSDTGLRRSYSKGVRNFNPLPLQVYSLDFARTRLANDAAEGSFSRQFTSLWSVYKKTYATDGIPGLYRGFNVSVVSKWGALGRLQFSISMSWGCLATAAQQ